MDWKNKYLKYKSKYLNLKKNLEKNSFQTGGNDYNIDNNFNVYPFEINNVDNKTYMDIIKNNFKEKIWKKETAILDCIKSTTMQTETNKLIDYMISNEIIELDKKALDIALTYAVFKGLYLIVEKLLKLGANPNLIYKNGSTLTDIAYSFYFYKTASILKKYGSHSKNFYSQTQLPIANTINKYDFSKDPENYVKDVDLISVNADNIYEELKESLLSKSPYAFENSLKYKFKDNIQID
jgi:hypothetical protein